MKLRQLFGLMLLLMTLAAFGCAGMDTLQTGADSAPPRMDCNGDVPSPFPPYCRPVR